MKLLHPFEELLYKKIVDCVEAWPDDLRSEVYATALCFWEFYVSYPEHTPIGERSKERIFQNVFSFSWNTRANVQQTLQQDTYLEPLEAEWMLQGWFPDGDEREVELPKTEDELALYHSWCDAMGVVRKAETDDYGNPIHETESLAAASIPACERIVESLHQNGVLRVPIVIFNVADGPEIEATRKANPPELLTEFNAFCQAMFDDEDAS